MDLTPNEAIVLQQVNEDGEDDARTLSRTLGLSRQHTMSILARLKHKGLVALNTSYDDLWVHMTKKGKALMSYVWPESRQLVY